MRESVVLPPENFEVAGLIDSDSGDLDLEFAWDPVFGAIEYRVYRRDLRVENQPWGLISYYDGSKTSGRLDYNLSTELADFQLRVVTANGESVPTFSRRVLYIPDPDNVVSDDGSIFATGNVDYGLQVPPVGVPLTTAIASRLATLAGTGGTVAVAEPTPAGEIMVAMAAVTIVVGTTVIYVAVKDDTIVIDGVALNPTATPESTPLQLAGDDVMNIIPAAIVAAGHANQIQARVATDNCVRTVNTAVSNGFAFPGSDADGLIDGKHPCEAMPLYFPSETDIPVPAQLRSDAIASYIPWIYQQRLKPPHNRAWLGTPRNINWPAGAPFGALALDGCLQNAKPQEPNIHCDEFPNASMVAGGGTSVPRPAVRWSPGPSENSLEGTRLNQMYTACGISGESADKTDDQFLVIPLTSRELGLLTPPLTFHFCLGQ